LGRLCDCCCDCWWGRCERGKQNKANHTFAFDLLLQPTSHKWDDLYTNLKVPTTKLSGRTHACPFDFWPEQEQLKPQLPKETSDNYKRGIARKEGVEKGFGKGQRRKDKEEDSEEESMVIID